MKTCAHVLRKEKQCLKFIEEQVYCRKCCIRDFKVATSSGNAKQSLIYNYIRCLRVLTIIIRKLFLVKQNLLFLRYLFKHCKCVINHLPLKNNLQLTFQILILQ